MKRNDTAAWLEQIAEAEKPQLPAPASMFRASLGLREFLEGDLVTETGPWSLEGHEPLGEIVAVIDRILVRKESGTEVSILAAEQVGKTMIAVGVSIHAVADLGRNVGYFLPTDVVARKFGRTRLKQLISRSPFLAGEMRDNSDAVNQATLKEFAGRFLYILGLESMLGAISIPLDVLINDEVDLLPAENLEWSQGRVAHSDLRFTLNVSAGYAPGAGIDERYQDGTMCKWLVDCTNRKCRRKEICLEETFPECVAKIRGRWARVCPDCHQEIDVKSGYWFATHPEKAKSRKLSYRVSSLIVPGRDLDHVMNRWEKAKRKKSQLAKFRCAELAMPDAGAMQPVTDAELREMESKDWRLGRAGSATQPRFAGMDTGDVCHFVVTDRDEHGRPRLVWAEEIDSDRAEGIVADRLMRFGVRQMVIDKKPLTTLARALAYRFPRVIALQDFTESSELKVVEELHERKPYRCVKVHRDESLDDLTSEITNPIKRLVIPPLESSDVLAIFATHLKNLRKERSLDAKGRAVDRYIKKAPNHFGMALNSARLAELISPSLMPFEVALPDGAQTGAWGDARGGWGAYRG